MTTVQAAAARSVACRLGALRDCDGEPTHDALESVLIPRLERRGRIEEPVGPRYREIGLRG
jgi:hypothetical protein